MRKLAIAMLTVTILIVGQGAVRGYFAAKNRPSYPCAFEVKVGKQWRAGLDLHRARQLQRKAVAIGKRIPVRYVHVGRRKVVRTIACVAKAYGMAPAPFLEVADCESTTTPDDNLFQYIGSTWETASSLYGHKGADVADAYANIHTTVRKVKDEGWGAWSCQP